MTDTGFTHVAFPVADIERSIAFYRRYAGLEPVHRRGEEIEGTSEAVWLGDGVRDFVLVLVEGQEMGSPLGPFAHLGIACKSKAEVDRLAEMAKAEGALRVVPIDTRSPAGYLAMLVDPDGNSVELSYGQDVGLATETKRVASEQRG